MNLVITKSYEENKFANKRSYKKIFRRWLAGAQIEFFVNIISDVAYMDQWQYRRKILVKVTMMRIELMMLM